MASQARAPQGESLFEGMDEEEEYLHRQQAAEEQQGASMFDDEAGMEQEQAGQQQQQDTDMFGDDETGEGNPQQDAAPKAQPKKKRVNTKPRFGVFVPTQMKSERGVQALYDRCKRLQFKQGKGKELENLTLYLSEVQRWATEMYPYGMQPEDFAKGVEKLSTKGDMQEHLMELRYLHKFLLPPSGFMADIKAHQDSQAGTQQKGGDMDDFMAGMDMQDDIPPPPDHFDDFPPDFDEPPHHAHTPAPQPPKPPQPAPKRVATEAERAVLEAKRQAALEKRRQIEEARKAQAAGASGAAPAQSAAPSVAPAAKAKAAPPPPPMSEEKKAEIEQRRLAALEKRRLLQQQKEQQGANANQQPGVHAN